MDIAMVVKKEKSKNTKKAVGVRLKLVKKYSVRLKTMLLQILYGRSHIIDEIPSATG